MINDSGHSYRRASLILALSHWRTLDSRKRRLQRQGGCLGARPWILLCRQIILRWPDVMDCIRTVRSPWVEVRPGRGEPTIHSRSFFVGELLRFLSAEKKSGVTFCPIFRSNRCRPDRSKVLPPKLPIASLDMFTLRRNRCERDMDDDKY